jgi:hypothetical protein
VYGGLDVGEGRRVCLEFRHSWTGFSGGAANAAPASLRRLGSLAHTQDRLGRVFG